MSNLRQALRRAATTLQRRAETQQTLTILKGTVSSVTPGAAADGGSAVSVNVGGSVIAAPYYGTAPAVGDVVHVLLIQRSPVILGKPVGLPVV